VYLLIQLDWVATMRNSQKILIVDDKPENLYALEQILSPLDAEIIKAESGNAALIASLNNEFAVAILDVQMPEMDGYELAGLLRHQEKTRNLPIIFLSAVYYGKDYAFKGYEAGAVDYINKPYSPTILLGKVSVFLELDQQRIESRNMARQLKIVNEELETRVQQRTKSLEKANEALQNSQKRLRRLSSRLLSAHEEERRRIAAELHDSIGSSLSAIKFSMENACCRLDPDKDAAQFMQPLIQMTKQTIGDVRRIINNLRPPELDKIGLIPTIKEFENQSRKIYGAIDVKDEISAMEEEIPEQLKIVIYRVIQEAFHNIARHSKAKGAHLTLRVNEYHLNLQIKDDGIGFDVQDSHNRESSGKSMGLSVMQERVELSGGRFSITTTPGHGTEIHADWPL
jgi:signal transduction histidine kinase